MDHAINRNVAVIVKLIGVVVLLVGLFFGAGDWGAGVYNDDKSQLGGGIQIIGITVGIGVMFLVTGGILDKRADDIREEKMMRLISEVIERRGSRRSDRGN